LTDNQKDQIQEINFEHRNGMIDLKAELQKAQLKMKQLHTGTPERTAALAIANEINSIEGRITEARINHKFDLRSVLNKEQLEKWQKCQQQCGGKCGPGGGRGGFGKCSPGCGPKCDHGGFGKGFGGHGGKGCDPAKCGKKCDPATCTGHGKAHGSGHGKACCGKAGEHCCRK
jgi:hypothetical protein